MKVDVKFKLFDPSGKRVCAEGFKYLWMKKVYDFNDQYHCAKCLVGPYIGGFHPKMLAEYKTTVRSPVGSILYFCGVAEPFDWKNNFHLAVQAVPKEEKCVGVHRMYNGFQLVIENAAVILFDDQVARKMYPEKSERFLSCRNFQFGAQCFSDRTVSK